MRRNESRPTAIARPTNAENVAVEALSGAKEPAIIRPNSVPKASGASVLHAVGGKNVDQHPAQSLEHFVTVDYVDRMDLAYAAADLALCRSGAMTVGELSAVGLPAIYVPLPVGNGEQSRNAAAVIAAGGGLQVDDAELDGDLVARLAGGLLGDPERLADIGRRAATQGARDAADKLATMVLQAAGGPR